MADIRDLLYVRFEIEDLDTQAQFLSDFGFQVTKTPAQLFARGYDPQPYAYIAEQGRGDAKFKGMGFEALSERELKRIAAIDNTPIEAIDLPSGGLRARLTDPDGNEVDIVYGISQVEPLTPPTRSDFNQAGQQLRLGERVGFQENATSIKRLGHCVLNVKDFRISEAWYKERIGFITSDEIYMGSEDTTLGAFMRLNRGALYVDHHTLFLVGAGQSEFNHAAFEVCHWDYLMKSHHTLNEQGYEQRWGVGKHLLGSQVFDYWKDPAGFTLEHFTDGDVFNLSFGSHKQPIEKLLAVHWGPEGAP
jgi:catechol-2,3-dioxygenase